MRTEITFKLWSPEKLSHVDLKTITLSGYESFASFRSVEIPNGCKIGDVGFWQFSDHNEMTIWLKEVDRLG